MADGVWIRHPTARSQTCLVELRHKRFYLGLADGKMCDGKGGRPLIPAPITNCPKCPGLVHEFKTVHLEVDDTGAALVSAGVLELIRSAGETGFEVVGHTATPPTLILGKDRAIVDYDNRKYRPLTPMKEVSHG
jgi:hypothetical protein